MYISNSSSKEQQKKIAEAIKNNDVDEYKYIIGYDSMSYSDQIASMVVYDDMVNIFRDISNVKIDNAAGPSLTVEDKAILDRVSQVARNTINKL